MSGQDPHDPAALWVLGLLDGDEHDAAERRLEEDSDFRREVEAWERRLVPLALAAPAVPPSDDVLFRIERRLDAMVSPDYRGITIRAREGRWHEWVPGVRAKLLNRRDDVNRGSFLVEVDPGAVFPTHPHEDDEECYMISGDLWFGDLELLAGDFHFAPRGTVHPPATSRRGCLCIIVKELH